MAIDTNSPNTNQHPDTPDDLLTSRSAPATREHKPAREPYTCDKSSHDLAATGTEAEADGEASPQDVRQAREAAGEAQRHADQGGDLGQGDTGHTESV